MEKIKVEVHSETGKLNAVILHSPGPEVENMHPVNAERALYSDILNLAVAKKEYSQLSCFLSSVSQTLFVKDLLTEILKKHEVRESLLNLICKNECLGMVKDKLFELEAGELSRQLIEGVPIERDNLSNYLSQDNFSMRPLHNFFFTRDSAVSLYNRVLISKMASRVRERESIIMKSIFKNHPLFEADTIDNSNLPDAESLIKSEGGDILVAREDILISGIGLRTSSQGIDAILESLKTMKDHRHIIVQELPSKPESFIHLDMVFTLLDQDSCMVYEPLILKPNRYQTVHIELDNGKVKKIKTVKNLPSVLKKLGMDLEPLRCGGRKDPVIQEREQWHSGANFFAFGPGRVIGYARNVHTLEEMNNNGFEILKAKDINAGKVKLSDYQKCVVSIDGSELSRGGGGARCMTMPVWRERLS